MITNKTNYLIDVFINGRPLGAASALGNFTDYLNLGANSFYGRTGSVDKGRFYFWGPNPIICSAEYFDQPIKLVINPK